MKRWHYWQQKQPLVDLTAFDDASRGPWGSVMLMRPRICARVPLVALLGAFIMVVSLAIDPFAQQIINFHAQTIAKPESSSSIIVSNSYQVYDNTKDCL